MTRTPERLAWRRVASAAFRIRAANPDRKDKPNDSEQDGVLSGCGVEEVTEGPRRVEELDENHGEPAREDDGRAHMSGALGAFHEQGPLRVTQRLVRGLNRSRNDP